MAFTIGPSLGPLLAGIIVYHTNNWQWVFWSFTIVCATSVHDVVSLTEDQLSFATFVATFFLATETLYLRDSPSARNLDKRQQYLSMGRINPAPFRVSELNQPYLMLIRPSVLVPACAYATTFCVASPGISIIIPTAYIETYGLNIQQVGLQFIAVLVGAILGEQIGGLLSDVAMKSKGKLGNVQRAPEFRLWASYLGFATVIGQFSASARSDVRNPSALILTSLHSWHPRVGHHSQQRKNWPLDRGSRNRSRSLVLWPANRNDRPRHL